MQSDPAESLDRPDPRPCVLVVEDDPSAAEIATAMFGMLGYRAQLATDAQSALRMLASTPPDLMMLDICLPDLDGSKVLRVARRLEDTASVPAIAASAIVARGAPEVAEMRRLGISEFLSKPFNLPALRTAVGRAHPAGPCGPKAEGASVDAELFWTGGRARVKLERLAPLQALLRTEARGLRVGQEVQLKVERRFGSAAGEQVVPIRVFGGLSSVRPTDEGSVCELRISAVVPREGWLGLCDDQRRGD